MVRATQDAPLRTWHFTRSFRGLGNSHGEDARQLIGMVALLELAPAVIERALEPFPIQVRTLDALHLASLVSLRSQGNAVRLATYDDRLTAAACRLYFPFRFTHRFC